MHLTDEAIRTVPAIDDRLEQLGARTGAEELGHVARGRHPFTGEPLTDRAEQDDWTDTVLMDVFRRTGDGDAVALLFERNRKAFLRHIRQLFTRWRPGMDVEDVLQEVFVNICRYPHRFRADCAVAFRKWSLRIVRNTVLGDVRGAYRRPVPVDAADCLATQVDERASDPETAAEHREAASVVDHAYLMLLQVFLQAFERLSSRDRELMEMVELQHLPYRRIADLLGATETTIKVRVFRYRQRVNRHVHDVLEAVTAAAA